jgi:2-polyprenyl-3-methyl-5-hydroxy-6-metoxy-1,4-benzoquinol methylase
MRERLLELIECRDCGSSFELTATEIDPGGEIISGSLACARCAERFPILRGIPRFIEGIKSEADLRKVYADSFGHQWTTYNWLRDEDEFEFRQITDLNPEDLAGKTVLDAGCGGGRLARVIAPHCKEFVGLDYSIAVDKAYELCKNDPHAHFIQCDINRQPFKKALFDFVYSHGVLHHTPDTKRSFDNLPALVKPGGMMYIAVFRKAFAPLRVTDTALRTAMSRLPIPVLDKICGAMSYLSYLPAAVFWKRFLWFSMQKTHEIRKCCLYDWYGPRFHHEHSVEEVQSWFEAAGFPGPKYINAWPYAPRDIKYAIPTFKDSLRLGLLLGVIGTRKPQV